MSELPRYSLKDVAKQNGKDGNRIWLVIHGMVYDVTNYINQHPGGVELIEEYAGQDATREFDEFGHSSDAKRLLKSYLIGELNDEDKMSSKGKKGASVNNGNETTKNGRRRFLAALCGRCAA